MGAEMKMTTIALTKKTKEKLCEFGKKGESYDKILQKLMKEAGGKKGERDVCSK